MKYSILYCVYNNVAQFRNSLFTAACQSYNDYQIVVVDNATPNDSIKVAATGLDLETDKHGNQTMLFKDKFVFYMRIEEKNKRCTNITQGMNLAALAALGDYIVIVADSNVLLSFNLLEKIDALIDPDTLVLSTGPTNDVKISPGGSKASEYADVDYEQGVQINTKLLSDMGWPCDPLLLDLSKVRHRYPPPHMARDCYIAAMSKEAFMSYGGYDESATKWGPYHEFFLDGMAKYLKYEKHLRGIKIIHQYHRVIKENKI